MRSENSKNYNKGVPDKKKNIVLFHYNGIWNPGRLLELYHFFRNPKLDRMFQHQRGQNKKDKKFKPHDFEESILYEEAPVGKTPLKSIMKKLSEDLELSQSYTNHCCRVSTLTCLDRMGFAARHMMAVSGNKRNSGT